MLRELSLLSSRLLVAPGALGSFAESATPHLKDVRKALILTDKNCARYAKPVERALKATGVETALESIPAGEPQKQLGTAAKLYDRMARFRMDRKSLLVAVGGGVITDLGGFVASTYMRGIPVILVPTTLLGQVDAAIGGKTGVNLPQGKNLVGTFYQPRAVFCDTEVLRTLPSREFTAGLGEVAKYVVIRDAELYCTIENNLAKIGARDPAVLDEIVYRCVKIKADVVSEDERESGLRAILNYGHTIGHGLEAAGNYRALHHGEAVAIGMEAEAFLAKELGMAPAEMLLMQTRLLKLCGLPTRAKKLPLRKVLDAMKLDKKGVDGRARFVLPEAIGRVRHGIEVPAPLILSALRAVTG